MVAGPDEKSIPGSVTVARRGITSPNSDGMNQRTSLVDLDGGRFLGQINGGFGITVARVARSRNEIYVAETHYSRGSRGERTLRARSPQQPRPSLPTNRAWGAEERRAPGQPPGTGQHQQQQQQ